MSHRNTYLLLLTARCSRPSFATLRLLRELSNYLSSSCTACVFCSCLFQRDVIHFTAQSYLPYMYRKGTVLMLMDLIATSTCALRSHVGISCIMSWMSVSPGQSFRIDCCFALVPSCTRAVSYCPRNRSQVLKFRRNGAGGAKL